MTWTNLFWRASVASETLTGVTQSKIGDVYLFIYLYITSGVLEHKWRASLKTILFLLTSNTEATENKVKGISVPY